MNNVRVFNWKTTIAGIIACLPSIIQAIEPILPDAIVPVLTSIATAIALHFAKDKDVAGVS